MQESPLALKLNTSAAQLLSELQASLTPEAAGSAQRPPGVTAAEHVAAFLLKSELTSCAATLTLLCQDRTFYPSKSKQLRLQKKKKKFFFV